MSLNGDKLLCSLYIKESTRKDRSEYFVLSTLKIYSNKILVLDIAKSNPFEERHRERGGQNPEFTVSSTSYYKSTITEEDLNIILNLCESNVLPP